MAVNQNDILEAAARVEYSDGSDSINVFQFQYISAPGISDNQANTDIITLIEQIYNLYVALMSLTTTFRDIRIRNKTQGVLMGTFPFSTLVIGGASGNENPHAVSGMISLPSAVPRVTLRKYMPRVTTPKIDPGGLWDAGMVTALVAVGAKLIATNTINGSQYVYGYLSPKTASWVRPVSAVVTDVPAYQRRRKPGRGS